MSTLVQLQKVPAGSPTQLLAEVRAYAKSEGVQRRVPIPADLGGGDDEWMGAVPGPDPASIPGIRRPFPDRPTLMSFVAVDQAFAAAALDTDGERGDLVGLVLDTCFGPSQTVERYLRVFLAQGPSQVSAIGFSRAVSNSVVGELARRHHLRGPSTAVLGSSALGYAVDLVQSGAARAVLCVGVDEVRDLHLWAYRRAGLFEGGLWLGEGAAALVLERRADAEARNAPILSAVAGYAMGFCGASVHRITDVTEDSIAGCMDAALHRAGRNPSRVDCVVSLANGDASLIEAERRAVEHMFKRELTWLRPKSVLGETFGASEAFAAVVASSALQMGEGSRGPVRTCIVNACQIGGGISSVVLERA